MRTVKSGVAVLSLAVLLASCGTLPALADSANIGVMMADMDWNGIDHTHCGFSSKQQLLDDVTGCAVTIAALTGRKDWTAFYGTGGATIEIRFTNSSSHVEGGYQSYLRKIPRIYINRTMAEYDFWPLAHELTHLMFPEYSCLTLREGLACYMQDEVGQTPAVFNYGLDVHAIACLYFDSLDTDPLVLTAPDASDAQAGLAAGDDRVRFYVCSYSFSRYLIETYGLGLFMQAYECGNFIKAGPLIFNRTAEGLVADWKQFLSEYPAKQSQEQIDQSLQELWNSHGYPEFSSL